MTLISTIGGVLLSSFPLIVPYDDFEYLKVGGGDFIAYPADIDPDFAPPLLVPPPSAAVVRPPVEPAPNELEFMFS